MSLLSSLARRSCLTCLSSKSCPANSTGWFLGVPAICQGPGSWKCLSICWLIYTSNCKQFFWILVTDPGHDLPIPFAATPSNMAVHGAPTMKPTKVFGTWHLPEIGMGIWLRVVWHQDRPCIRSISIMSLKTSQNLTIWVCHLTYIPTVRSNLLSPWMRSLYVTYTDKFRRRVAKKNIKLVRKYRSKTDGRMRVLET